MFDIFPYEELSDILIQIKFDDLSEQGRINCILENHAAYASSISEMETILNTNTIILTANNIYELASLIEEENPKDAVPYYSNIIDGKYPELSLHTYLFALLHYHRIKDGTKPLAENTSFTTILLNKLKDESYIENIGVFLSFVHLNNVIDIEPFIPYYEKYVHNGGKIDSWGMQQLLKIYIQNKEYRKFGRLYSTAYSGNDNIVSNQFGSMDYLLKYGECALVYNNAISTNDLYNNLLSRKNKDLTISIAYENLIETTNDSLILNKHKFVEDLRLQLHNKNDQIKLDDIVISAKQASIILMAMEEELRSRCYRIGGISNNLKFTVNDIQEALNGNEIAIEFTEFIDFEGVTRYGALILKPQSDVEFVELCNIDELPAPEALQDIVDKIIRPLQSHTLGCSRIYISLDGYLNAYPIETAWESNYDTCVIRLSSTRELAIDREIRPTLTSSVFGGIYYDLLNTYNRIYDKTLTAGTDVLLALRDSPSFRNTVKFLPQSLVEGENISSFLLNQKFSNKFYSGYEGTESNFKRISNATLDIVHIATHGYYWTEKDSRRNGGIELLKGSFSDDIGYQDKQLLRSGLLFSGAQQTLNGKMGIHGSDDGILTAFEISKLNLRGVNFVALSACQTALGDVTEDGIVGLQRGFKKAGVNSMMLSLWKVDDEATQIFMTKFYERFLQGESKHHSLIYAQNYLKNFSKTIIENGVKSEIHPYSDPKYWSAFILLDANE